jgi:hypothetical protein
MEHPIVSSHQLEGLDHGIDWGKQTHHLVSAGHVF